MSKETRLAIIPAWANKCNTMILSESEDSAPPTPFQSQSRLATRAAPPLDRSAKEPRSQLPPAVPDAAARAPATRPPPVRTSTARVTTKATRKAPIPARKPAYSQPAAAQPAAATRATPQSPSSRASERIDPRRLEQLEQNVAALFNDVLVGVEALTDYVGASHDLSASSRDAGTTVSCAPAAADAAAGATSTALCDIPDADTASSAARGRWHAETARHKPSKHGMPWRPWPAGEDVACVLRGVCAAWRVNCMKPPSVDRFDCTSTRGGMLTCPMLFDVQAGVTSGKLMHRQVMRRCRCSTRTLRTTPDLVQPEPPCTYRWRRRRPRPLHRWKLWTPRHHQRTWPCARQHRPHRRPSLTAALVQPSLPLLP